MDLLQQAEQFRLAGQVLPLEIVQQCFHPVNQAGHPVPSGCRGGTLQGMELPADCGHVLLFGAIFTPANQGLVDPAKDTPGLVQEYLLNVGIDGLFGNVSGFRCSPRRIRMRWLSPFSGFRQAAGLRTVPRQQPVREFLGIAATRDDLIAHRPQQPETAPEPCAGRLEITAVHRIAQRAKAAFRVRRNLVESQVAAIVAQGVHAVFDVFDNVLHARFPRWTFLQGIQRLLQRFDVTPEFLREDFPQVLVQYVETVHHRTGLVRPTGFRIRRG